MSELSKFFKEKLHTTIDLGGFDTYLRDKIYKPLWQDPLEGGRWLQSDPAKQLMIPDMLKDINESWGGGKWWTDRLGGSTFDRNWGGGAWSRDRLGFGGGGTNEDDDESSSSSGDGGPAKPNEYTYNINVGGLDLTEMESERERADRMRRMLAGRYGRGETNLTGGTGFGTGSQRTLGGYS